MDSVPTLRSCTPAAALVGTARISSQRHVGAPASEEAGPSLPQPLSTAWGAQACSAGGSTFGHPLLHMAELGSGGAGEGPHSRTGPRPRSTPLPAVKGHPTSAPVRVYACMSPTVPQPPPPPSSQHPKHHNHPRPLSRQQDRPLPSPSPPTCTPVRVVSPCPKSLPTSPSEQALPERGRERAVGCIAPHTQGGRGWRRVGPTRRRRQRPIARHSNTGGPVVAPPRAPPVCRGGTTSRACSLVAPHRGSAPPCGGWGGAGERALRTRL